MALGFAHNHPTGYEAFSEIDSANERALLEALSNRNGGHVNLVALLLANGTWKGRVRSSSAPNFPVPARHIAIIGSRIQLGSFAQQDTTGFRSRQAAAFGQPFVEALASLRVGVIGASGTGSPVITLLARAGVGEILIIDNDCLDETNLNRVRGARKSDVGEYKADVLARFVDALGLPVKTASMQSLIDVSPDAVDALSTCDVVFGCTDDQLGRQLLNSALYAFAFPLIDLGLGGHVTEKDEDAVLRSHFGRISVIFPEFGECLFCQGVLREVWIRHQEALRENPALTEEQARERYLEGGGEGAPGVGPFTSATADFGVATLFDLLKPFRRFPAAVRKDQFFIDFVNMEINSRGQKGDFDCPYCGAHEFTNLNSSHRLGRPSLGRRTVHV
ncbi:HesA/MoeB/ThiF family protein [Arenimonas malthae]|uniref:HesA/MoeB/ThiF family protein n=1 Tax=Arenimonas malthae TaxID=354197 RepID=UPI001B8068B6|nr:ThiF family adenylyltransferase [Arenimonas malthae]